MVIVKIYAPFIFSRNPEFSCSVSDPQLDFFHRAMARSRPVDNQRSRSKSSLLEELTANIVKFQEVLREIEDFSQEGFPYRDAAQAKAELKLKERVRHTFGERSQEFQRCRTIKLRTGNNADTEQSKAVIKGLIQTLEDRKLELQGLKPPPPPTPPPDATMNNTARLVLVTPATSATGTAQTATPMTVAVAMTTNVGPPISTTAPAASSKQEPPEPKPSTLLPVPSAPDLPAPPSLPPASSTAIVPPIETVPPLPSPPREQPVMSEKPIPPPPMIVAPTPPEPLSQPNNTPIASAVVMPVGAQDKSAPIPHVSQDTPLDRLLTGLSGARTIQPTSLDPDPLSLIRKVCLRFHSVARQLRLRKDYRPTLEVEDDYDLQDLFCALLKVEFDEVATDEWIPPYTDGAPRTTFFVNKDQIAILTKKTRPGLTTKELVDQVTTDAAHYRAQDRCSTLFCFLYDPEGRIGSPKRLETTLTSVSEHCTVEVLVAPK